MGKIGKISKLLLLLALLLTSCAAFKGSLIPSDSKKVEYLLDRVDTLYAAGVEHNINREWGLAQADFEEALRLISTIDVKPGTKREILARIDNLLGQISYDYQYTMRSLGDTSYELSPMELALALESSKLSGEERERLEGISKRITPDETTEFDFPVVWNERVREKLALIETELREPMERWLGRFARYEDMMKSIFREEGLPEDLAYLAIVESGVNPRAYSYAHASGMWQFMRDTGKSYGLQSDWWRDDRRNPESSTKAAAKHLKKLYNMYGDWYLALAAYNCGEGNLNRAIKRCGTRDFWQLKLHPQTEDYLPMFIATLIVAKNPARYGLSPKELPPMEFDTVYVGSGVDLRVVAECTDTTLDFIKEINPEILRWCTPPDVTKCQLRIPKGKKTQFDERYAKIPSERKHAWVRYKIRKGDTLSGIAKRFSTNVGAIMDVNKMTKHDTRRLRIGRYILIPVPPDKLEKYAKYNKDSGTAVISKGKSTYTVKKNDTLSGIAQRLGVSVSSLMKWNGLGKHTLIHPGDKLVYYSGKTASQKVTYTVKRNDTLSGIAARFGTTVADIERWNKIDSKKIIHPGDKLVLFSGKAAKSGRSSSRGKKVIYVVKKGDSLSEIAYNLGVKVSDIRAWNGKRSNLIHPGERLVVYTQEPRTKNYTVKSGDTIWSIASREGADVRTILSQNSISDPKKIKPGDKIIITTNN